MSIKVLKFGGTSVGSPEALRLAAAIIRAELPEGGVVVVSALSGTTDQILKAVAAAGRGNTNAALELLGALEVRHRTAADALGVAAAVEAAWAHPLRPAPESAGGHGAALGDIAPGQGRGPGHRRDPVRDTC